MATMMPSPQELAVICPRRRVLAVGPAPGGGERHRHHAAGPRSCKVVRPKTRCARPCGHFSGRSTLQLHLMAFGRTGSTLPTRSGSQPERTQLMDTFNAVGRLTDNPVADATANGTPVVTFRLAVDATKTHTDFLPVKVYGDYSTTVGKYATKGRLVQVAGRVHQNTWTTDDGQNRERLEIVARSVKFLDSRPAKALDAEADVVPGEEAF